jgi:DNA adenine methylase
VEKKEYYKDKPFLKQFGLRLLEVRKSKGLSQEALAHACDFPPSQIGRIERGEVNTNLSHVAKIAEALGVRPEELFKF